ncbi:uncharacterized protein LOC141631057 [Silene latifolia]|uniref:uncharacterized protein LOC141631057 n=1 Tax=Silene latifolia TaxID=37657 RepID=UPI003D77A45F
MSTKFHPPMDGQTEKTIKTLEDKLRAYVMEFSGSWEDRLDLIDFSYNNSHHTSIGMTPFEALYRQRFRSPICWDNSTEAIVLEPEMVQEMVEQNYDLFTMEPKESLDGMSARFSSIIDELKNLGRMFEFEDISRKVLRCLTKKWRSKVIAIEESRDLTSLSYQELIGALMAHEIVLDNNEAEPSKGKSMALHASVSDNTESDTEDEKKATESKTSFTNRGCFKCGESNHMIKDCPIWEKIKDKTKREKTKNEFKQVMLASYWGDLDTEDNEGSEDEEVANLCLSNISLDLISDSDDESMISSSECYLKEQILDIAEENHHLKAKAKKIKSKVTANKATTSDWTNAEKLALKSKIKKKEMDSLNQQLKESKTLLSDTKKLHSEMVRVLNKRFQNFRDNYKENNPSKDVELDHFECLKEIQSLKDLLLHARKVVVKEINLCDLDSGCSRFAHISSTILNKLKKWDLVKGLPSINFDQKTLCDSCAHCKYVRSSFKPERVVSTKEPLELAYMDLCRPKKDEKEDMNEPDFRLSRDDPPELDEEDNEIERGTILGSQSFEEGEPSSNDNDVPSVSMKWRYKDSHPMENIIGNLRRGVQTRRELNNFCSFYSFISTIEPTNIKEALAELDWIVAMQEGLQQFERNKVWHLVPRRMKLFQMDVKIAFINGYFNEEVFVEQPPGFLDSKFQNHVYKLDKALYGLKQAPRAWSSEALMNPCFNTLHPYKVPAGKKSCCSDFLPDITPSSARNDDDVFLETTNKYSRDHLHRHHTEPVYLSVSEPGEPLARL